MKITVATNGNFPEENYRAEDEFRKTIKGKNFMTPKALQYYEIHNGVVELSEGEGIEHTPLFGVTVVRDGKSDHESSDCFSSLDKALQYIGILKEGEDMHGNTGYKDFLRR